MVDGGATLYIGIPCAELPDIISCQSAPGEASQKTQVHGTGCFGDDYVSGMKHKQVYQYVRLSPRTEYLEQHSGVEIVTSGTNSQGSKTCTLLTAFPIGGNPMPLFFHTWHFCEHEMPPSFLPTFLPAFPRFAGPLAGVWFAWRTSPLTETEVVRCDACGFPSFLWPRVCARTINKALASS